jgi:threonine aldolase
MSHAALSLVDLRSDTVTRPTPGMRAAMHAAEVGDDVFREDPTVNRLEQEVAALLDKPAALFVPSGTMANQLALRLHTEHGDEVLCADGAHVKWYETGAAAALGGVQLSPVGRGGLFSPEELAAAFVPARGDHAGPVTRLCWIENTHNRAGGKVWPLDELDAVCGAARALGLALHLDGARLWNAAVRLGVPPARIAAAFDTVSVCLSKGLGAPVGSLLVGSPAAIERARRFRKMYGGGMRQAGVLAAAGLYALHHNLPRLAEDHENAAALAAALMDVPGVSVVPPDTNILLLDLLPPLPDAETVLKALAGRGVLGGAFGPRRVRLVTHLDVDVAACRRAAEQLRGVLCGA